MVASNDVLLNFADVLCPFIFNSVNVMENYFVRHWVISANLMFKLRASPWLQASLQSSKKVMRRLSSCDYRGYGLVRTSTDSIYVDVN